MTEPRRPAAAAWLAVTALVALLGSAGAAALPLSDAQILAAYDYLLARALVAARQHDELEHGMTWNQLVHRDAPSPAEPDVLLSDAWIALDDASCAVLSLPAAGGRYLDAQLIDGWGTTLAHVNPRRYPYHPSGEFALCRRGARSALPRGAERLELPVSIVRLRVRVAVGADLDAARRLQQQIALVSTGSPAPPESVCLPPFSQAPLPGLEMFDNADALLRDAPDPAPDADRAQQAVRAVAAALANPLQRNRVETVIQRQAIPRVQLDRLRLGAQENGWLRWQPLAGSVDEPLTRALLFLDRPWANDASGMVELIATPEGSGTLSFPRYGWPQSRGFGPWSLTAVDAETGLPVDTPHARLTADSTLQAAQDGSLRVVVAAQLPDGIPESNWIQIPPDRPYRLVFRFYAPGPLLEAGDWFPPPLSRSE